jgi:hypothetical protein
MNVRRASAAVGVVLRCCFFTFWVLNVQTSALLGKKLETSGTGNPSGVVQGTRC